VQAAVVVAQQCPRDIQAAVAEMRESCKQMTLAERAFYRYPKGGQTITGGGDAPRRRVRAVRDAGLRLGRADQLP